MDPRTRNLFIVLSLTTLLAGAQARGEGVTERSKRPATTKRIFGVQTLLCAPSGVYSLGGPELRFLPKDGSAWKVLYRIKGDDLYRLAVDDAGRVLAVWSKDDRLHLFTPQGGHRTFPKPLRVRPGFRSHGIDGLNFSKDGKYAIVFENGVDKDQHRITVAHQYDLGANSGPVELLRESGYLVYRSNEAAIFAHPKDPKVYLDGRNFRLIGAFVAYEFKDGKVSEKVIYTPSKEGTGLFRLCGANEAGEVVVLLEGYGNKRQLLRWRPGQSKARVQPHPAGARFSDMRSFLDREGTFYEFSPWDEDGLIIRTLSSKGRTGTLILAAPPVGDIDVGLDSSIYAIRERAKGGLVFQWGDYLYLMDGRKPLKRFDLSPLLVGQEEWAGVDLYNASPEALWLGVEVGPSRDFIRLGFDEIDKKAKGFQ